MHALRLLAKMEVVRTRPRCARASTRVPRRRSPCATCLRGTQVIPLRDTRARDRNGRASLLPAAVHIRREFPRGGGGGQRAAVSPLQKYKKVKKERGKEERETPCRHACTSAHPTATADGGGGMGRARSADPHWRITSVLVVLYQCPHQPAGLALRRSPSPSRRRWGCRLTQTTRVGDASSHSADHPHDEGAVPAVGGQGVAP